MMPDEDIFVETVELRESDKALIRLYEEIGRSVDELAYTEEFDELHKRYRQAGFQGEKHDVFRRLLALRKAGLLPRLYKPAA